MLSVFSATVSVTTSRGTEQAQRAAVESDLHETASEVLLVQEEVVPADDADTRTEPTPSTRR